MLGIASYLISETKEGKKQPFNCLFIRVEIMFETIDCTLKRVSDIEIHAASINIVNIKHAIRISDVDRTSINVCMCTPVNNFIQGNYRYGDPFKVCLTVRVMRWPIERS